MFFGIKHPRHKSYAKRLGNSNAKEFLKIIIQNAILNLVGFISLKKIITFKITLINSIRYNAL